MAASNTPNIKEGFKQFDFTEEVIHSFRENNVIPIDFYNKDGQILIHNKVNASPEDINRLKKFEVQGIFYRTEDFDKLGFKSADNRPRMINGREVSYSKVVNADLAVGLARDTTSLLMDLKKAPMQGFHFRAVSKTIDNILTDFTQTKDMENGLLNIIEVMSGAGAPTDSEVITKRTVIAMALKIRGMKALSKADTEIQKTDQMNMMVSCYLCDIGYTQMKMPVHGNLTPEEFNYIKNHPMISYLMIAGVDDVSEKAKANVLNHHRPFRGDGPNNNYPNAKVLIEKLTALQKKYSEDQTKFLIAQDIPKQIKNIMTFTAYDEDVSIISIAGEYSSLTTNQPWRGAFDTMTAMKMIMNNSFFSYNERIVKEFFEYVGVSLCENKSVLSQGDYVITVSADSEKKIHFEICVILEINRTQIRPLLERIGTIQPVFSNIRKLEIAGFNLATLKTDRRRAKYNLETGDPRRVIYIIDPHLKPELFDEVDKNYRQLHPRSGQRTP